MSNRWIGVTCKMDMMTIDSGRVSSPHVVKLMRVMILWETLDIKAARLMLFLLSHSYSDSFIWCWKSNCKWMKCKAYLKTKTNTLFPAHGYPAITQTHYSNLYQFFESGRPKHCVLKSNTILQPGFSRLVKLLCNPDISEQKVLDPFPCLQGVRPCPAHREQRGSRTRC